MNRLQVMDSIINRYRELEPQNQIETLREILKRIPDADLWVLAQTMGIVIESHHE
jgi:hypothetical protein